jgi:hypothetical protein
MLAYYLPSFLDYLSNHYYNLYTRYVGRLIELFPSSEDDDSNLVITHENAESTKYDEWILQLWKKFRTM